MNYACVCVPLMFVAFAIGGVWIDRRQRRREWWRG